MDSDMSQSIDRLPNRVELYQSNDPLRLHCLKFRSYASLSSRLDCIALKSPW